jgi:hypothetical protein
VSTPALDDFLQGLADRLVNAKAKGSVPLDGPTLEDPGGAVIALFETSLGVSAIPLDGTATIAQDPSADSLTVSGPATTTLAGIVNPAVSCVFTTATDPETSGSLALHVVLTITPTQPWTLATTFPHLAQTDFGKLTLDSKTTPKLVLRSVDGSPDAYGPVEQAGLNLELTAIADGQGPLQGLGQLMKLQTNVELPLAGWARLGADTEAVSLRAPSGGATAQLAVTDVYGGATLTLTQTQVGISGSATRLSDGTWTPALGLSALGSTVLGSTSLPVAVDVPVGGSAWRLRVVGGAGAPFGAALALIPGLSLAAMVPSSITGALDAEVEAFTLTLSGAPGSFAAGSLECVVSALDDWTLVPGVIELAQLRFGFQATWPSPTAVGWIQGAIELDGVPVTLRVPLPLSSGAISIAASPSVTLKLSSLAKLIGGADLAGALPVGFEDAMEVILYSFSLTFDPSVQVGPTAASLALGTDTWKVIDNQLEVEQVVLRLELAMSGKATTVNGSISALLAIGEDDPPVLVAVTVERWGGPDWELDVIAENIQLPRLADFTSLAGGTDLTAVVPDAIATASFEIASIELAVDLSKGQMERFSTVVQTDAPWTIVGPKQLVIEQVIARLDLDWRSGRLVTTGSIDAAIDLEDTVYLDLDAAYQSDGGWVVGGELTQPVSISKLVSKAIGVDVDHGIAKGIEIDTLSFSYGTLHHDYAFAASAGWKPQLDGIDLDVDASVALERKPGDGGGFAYSGSIAGDLKGHFGSDQLDLSVAYMFHEAASTSYVFKVSFNGVGLTATYTNTDGNSVITARLTGVTFGGVIEYLVNLVDPSLHFELSSPWDVLNKISFDDVALSYNLTTRAIGITADVNVNLGLVDVESISLTYLSKGGKPTVGIALTGSFLGQEYKDPNPLSWDLLNESPPPTPGAGAATFDLQTLGVGQHLVLADPKATDMQKILDDLDQEVLKVKGQPNPWELLQFEPQAGWLLAAKFTVKGTVTVGIVFDDPQAYGAQIKVEGPNAGVFAGLDFQILYRKVSADVGVYHIALKLPDQMRHIELGEVSVTLPSVVIDIYTDGGFYLDFGFPYNNDWSVCFGLQVFPFVGAGGFYIGRLTAADGAGPDLVPAITNGTFGPVVELGLAFNLGVGKSISEGPFSAGVSVTTQGVMTGVVAWFNPTDKSLPSERYFRVNGSLAVVGTLYGSVDFKVISIDVSLVASVTATVSIEAYAPIELGLSVDVEVEASIKILFVRIHFSFSMHVDASFTIGSQQQTPWQLASGAGGQPQATLAARRRMEGANELRAAAQALALAVAAEPPPLTWSAADVITSKPCPRSQCSTSA